MDLVKYIRRLAGRWRVIAFVTVVCVGAATITTALTTRLYQTHTTYYASTSHPNGDINSAMASSVYAQQQVLSYAAVASSQRMAAAVVQELNLNVSPSVVQSEISTSVDYGTVLVHVTVTDPSPTRALAIAESISRQYNRVLAAVDTSNVSGVKVGMSMLTPPALPTSPSSPHAALNILLGLVAGLLLGLGLAALRDVLDNRIKTSEQLVKAARAPSMGVIVDDPKTKRHVIASRAGAQNIRAENFRQLRANLQFANVDQHPRVIAVTSAIPSEGKTTVAINLASSLAEAGFTVCLVDADLRRPTVAKTLGMAAAVGLTSVLIHQISLNDALQSAGSNLYVLTSGPLPPNPSEVLASSFVRTVIRQLLDKVDYVILDTAPLLPVSDGSEVCALADGALLVARTGATTEPMIRRGVQTLRQVDAKLLGVVLNRVALRRSSSEYGYSYYRYETKPTSRRAQARAARSERSSDGAKEDAKQAQLARFE
jgi:non-specific protein-tyrosine kinase